MRVLSFFLMILFCTLPVYADTTLEFTDNEQQGVSFEIQADKVRINKTDDKNYMLYFQEDANLYMVDTEQQSVQKLSEKAIDDMIAQAVNIRTMLQLKAAHLDAAELQRFKQNLGDMAGLLGPLPEYTLEKTSKQKQILGISCSVANVAVNNQPKYEYCVQAMSQLAIGDSEQVVLSALLRLLAKMTQGFAAEDNPLMALSLEDLGGFPVLITAVASNERSELTDIKHEKIPTERFLLPNNYQRLDF